MKFSELKTFDRFIVPSVIFGERGHEVEWMKIPPCMPIAKYKEDMKIVMLQLDAGKNRNYLNHQLARSATAISVDGQRFVHISDETEIEYAKDG
jgi:hypothetical protein